MTRAPVGVQRLDVLLDGGLPRHGTFLVYGPPFVGKKTLSALFGLAAMKRGEPSLFITTSETVGELRERLMALEPSYQDLETKGLAHFVDAYSKSIGAEDDVPQTEFVDGPVNLNGLTAAVVNAQRRMIKQHDEHCVVVDSISTLVAYSNAQTTFRFLQVLAGRMKRAGATTVMLLEQGMHADAEVQMFKHLAQGVVELKPAEGRHQLHIEGAGLAEDRGWVDYRHSPTAFQVTGSFAAGRIR